MRIRTLAVALTLVALAASTRANNEGRVTDLHLGESPAASSVSATTVHPPRHPWWMQRPCRNEDSVNCYWNARLQGNGHGKSFYVRKMPHTHNRHGQPLVCQFFVNRRESRYDQCWWYAGGGR